MIYEDIRAVHEDIERMEEAIAERLMEDPKTIRGQLIRDHEIANFLERIRAQSERGLRHYAEHDARTHEIQQLSTGDTFATFYSELQQIRDFHKRNPNEPVENTERMYKRLDRDGSVRNFAGNIDTFFTGEEMFGRFFDLTLFHEQFLNLPGIIDSRKYTYLQYLDVFDLFTKPKSPLNRDNKMTEAYFAYITGLAKYLESFMRKVKPLENHQQLLDAIDKEFEDKWSDNKIPGWEASTSHTNGTSGPITEGTGEGIWCADCQKEFNNENVYKGHLNGKKHKKNTELRAQQSNGADDTNARDLKQRAQRLEERAVAEREWRVLKLAGAMQTQRADTRGNVERKHGMTDKERQLELAALYEEEYEATGDTKDETMADSGDENSEDKVYNPLKLPISWDGKPIPFWLYKLHGLGAEFTCEICGNFVYKGRRNFDKHFSEAQHIQNLLRIGIDKQTNKFREITRIEDAQKLWAKMQQERADELARRGGEDGEDVVEMEDAEGHVMNYKTWNDLRKMGLL